MLKTSISLHENLLRGIANDQLLTFLSANQLNPSRQYKYKSGSGVSGYWRSKYLKVSCMYCEQEYSGMAAQEIICDSESTRRMYAAAARKAQINMGSSLDCINKILNHDH